MFDLFIRRLEEVFTLPLGCEGSMSEDTVTFFFSRGTRTIIGAAVVGEMFEQRGACSGPMWSTTWYVLYARYFLCRGMSHEAGWNVSSEGGRLSSSFRLIQERRSSCDSFDFAWLVWAMIVGR